MKTRLRGMDGPVVQQVQTRMKSYNIISLEELHQDARLSLILTLSLTLTLIGGAPRRDSGGDQGQKRRKTQKRETDQYFARRNRYATAPTQGVEREQFLAENAGERPRREARYHPGPPGLRWHHAPAAPNPRMRAAWFPRVLLTRDAHAAYSRAARMRRLVPADSKVAALNVLQAKEAMAVCFMINRSMAMGSWDPYIVKLTLVRIRTIVRSSVYGVRRKM